MSHERTLQAALSGGPLPLEVRDHLEGCRACRDELRALKALEAELALAAPASLLGPEWEPEQVRRLAAPRPRTRRWLAAAASLLLAAGLLAAWVDGTRRAPGSASLALAPAQAAHEARKAYLWPSDDDDSTAALLQSAEPLAREMPASPPAALENYLAPSENGGWNG